MVETTLHDQHDPSTTTQNYDHYKASISISSPTDSGSQPKPPKKPYSVFTTNQKWFIVLIASFAGLFSPLTANIYFPAIPAIAVAFNKSTELINLTVTVYMVMQGVAPMIWGTLADRVGRRPIYLACLLVLALSCVGLALVPTNAYWLLMLLRCIQAGGSASTIALAAGTVGDVADVYERGGFFGLYSLGPMVGPAIGPVIGGGLADRLGWRAIFWFLCIGSVICFLFMLLFLPETLRSIVGDGSIRPSRLYRPLVPIIGRGKDYTSSGGRLAPRARLNPFRLFTYPDILLLLFYNGIIYAVFYAVTATISTLFQQAYPFLSETDIGLCFLAIGGGMVAGSLINGKLLDREYRKVENNMIREVQADPEKRIAPEDVTKEENFPIEKARLRLMPIYLAIFVSCCMGYGWCLQKQVSLAGPLILQIIIGYTVIAVMNTTQTLIIDLIPSQSSSITACNNLIRCSLGAASVSVIDLIVNAIGTGWTYILLGGICLVASPAIWLEIYIGPKCRARRRQRAAKD